jgi:hypothetical protein
LTNADSSLEYKRARLVSRRILMDWNGISRDEIDFLISRFGGEAAAQILGEYEQWVAHQNHGVYDLTAYTKWKRQQRKRKVSYAYESKGVATLAFLVSLGLMVGLLSKFVPDAHEVLQLSTLVLAFTAALGAVKLHARWRKMPAD